MFYNLENLFDTFDDPVTNDDEFTPENEKSWTHYRYQQKLNNLAKVKIALGQWSPPVIIGLCEIENFQVLLDLTTKTPLTELGYQIIHENSNDERGIDVAIIYRHEFIEKISHQSLNVQHESEWKARNILLAEMVIDENDTQYTFINHWPSRYGGKERTEHKRIKTANTVKFHVDSLQKIKQNTKILVMGDFNDEPEDQSIREILCAQKTSNDLALDQLYNLSYTDFQACKGTLVYKEINNTWFLFDQIIASGSLINNNGLITKGRKCIIFYEPWILRNDKPYRT